MPCALLIILLRARNSIALLGPRATLLKKSIIIINAPRLALEFLPQVGHWPRRVLVEEIDDAAAVNLFAKDLHDPILWTAIRAPDKLADD